MIVTKIRSESLHWQVEFTMKKLQEVELRELDQVVKLPSWMVRNYNVQYLLESLCT